MKFKKITPTTSSQRSLIKLNLNFLSKKPLIKNKIKGLKISSGRNNSGKITSYHKGGGHKKRYRILNFNRTSNSEGIVTTIEYDPFRNCFIASVFDFIHNYFYYILAPKQLKIGSVIKTGLSAELKLGHSLPLSKLPIGSFLHSLTTCFNKKASITRSAGTSSKLLEKNNNYGKLKMSSKKHIYIKLNNYATIGTISNEDYWITTKGKAGRTRWLNIRPTVRGVAMNPVDHPHGGGEGKTSGVRALTPWGKPTKNGKKKKHS